jgi:hypothetical protein
MSKTIRREQRGEGRKPRPQDRKDNRGSSKSELAMLKRR